MIAKIKQSHHCCKDRILGHIFVDAFVDEDLPPTNLVPVVWITGRSGFQLAYWWKSQRKIPQD
jgi:hypothetical protein